MPYYEFMWIEFTYASIPIFKGVDCDEELLSKLGS